MDNKKYRRILVIVLVIACIFPLFMDYCILGNRWPSNLDNSEWASFLGSYIGGIATIAAVFLTIIYTNNLNNEAQTRRREEEREKERLLIKPYISTRYKIATDSDEFHENDRVFDIYNDEVKYIRFSLNDNDKRILKRSPVQGYYINYKMVNVGASSAVEMTIDINGFKEKYELKKDETASLFLMANVPNPPVILKIGLDYWDIEQIGHYQQKDEIIIQQDEEGLLVSKFQLRENIKQVT